MNLHRILCGSPERRPELIAAGIFVAVWFGIDAHQYGDFLWQKFHPQQGCIPATFMPPSLVDPMLPPLPMSPPYAVAPRKCTPINEMTMQCEL